MSSFLLFSFCRKLCPSKSSVVKVILHDDQCTYSYRYDRTIGKSEQGCIVSPYIRGQHSFDYLYRPAREVVAEEVDRREVRGLEVVGQGDSPLYREFAVLRYKLSRHAQLVVLDRYLDDAWSLRQLHCDLGLVSDNFHRRRRLAESLDFFPQVVDRSLSSFDLLGCDRRDCVDPGAGFSWLRSRWSL